MNSHIYITYGDLLPGDTILVHHNFKTVICVEPVTDANRTARYGTEHFSKYKITWLNDKCELFHTVHGDADFFSISKLIRLQ